MIDPRESEIQGPAERTGPAPRGHAGAVQENGKAVQRGYGLLTEPGFTSRRATPAWSRRRRRLELASW